LENTHLAPKNPEKSGTSPTRRYQNINESYGDPSVVELRDLTAQLEIFKAEDEDENNKYLAEYGDAIYECDADDPAHRELVAVLIAEPDAPPADLAGLRAWKASRTPSSIIKARRAAQALAASRMAAKVTQDKLEARMASSGREIAPRELAQDILHHIRTDDKTPEQGVSDYELEGELAAEVLGLVYEMDAAQDLPDGDGRMPQRRRRGVAQ